MPQQPLSDAEKEAHRRELESAYHLAFAQQLESILNGGK